MKPPLLSRYNRNPAGQYLIDVAAPRAESLYSHYDRNAPYIRRDLDPNLVDYLIDCARELDTAPFVLSFSLEQPADGEAQTRIRRSMHGYFRYLIEVERQLIRQMMRRAAILFGIGLVILFFALSLAQGLAPDHSVVADVFAEGMIIVAWVSLWEAVAVILIEWFPHRKTIRLYRRLADVAIHFDDGRRTS